MRRLALIFLLLAPAIANAQETPNAPEPYLLLNVNRDCGSEAQDKQLAEEIRLRIPRVFFVRGILDG